MSETVVAQGLILLKSRIYTLKLDKRQLRGPIKKTSNRWLFWRNKNLKKSETKGGILLKYRVDLGQKDNPTCYKYLAIQSEQTQLTWNEILMRT